MQDFIILHSNDIHGRVDGLARLATLIEQIRNENPEKPVLYLDAGDSEETSQRLSNLTKGVAMYRLLDAAGCAASTTGNGGLPRYGPHILQGYASVIHYPQLLANLRNPDGAYLPGVQPTALLAAGSCKLGIIGLTAPELGDDPIYEAFFGLRVVPLLPLIRELTADLHQQGADTVILLSHLGLFEDRKLAEQLQGEIPLIIGAHSHNLLPQGERAGEVFIAQAGEYAEHLGRLDLHWDETHLHIAHASVLPVTADIPPSPRLQAEIKSIEDEVESLLNDVIGELAEELDFATDRECGVANLMADALRERMKADVAIITTGVAFNGPLPAGFLKRLALWEVCPSPANPGVAAISGEQLSAIIECGLNAAFIKETPRVMRGQQRGLLHLSGASVRAGQIYVGEQPIETARTYSVAASDWELDSSGGCVQDAWRLKPSYEVQTILREVIEDYLKGKPRVSVQMGRLDLS